MYCKSEIVSFCKPTLTFWELCTNLTREIYRNMCYPLVLAQLLMREVGKGPVEKYYVVLNVECEDLNMNDCKPLNFQDN